MMPPPCIAWARKGGLWAAFTPGGHGLRRTWQLAVAARSRGGAKVIAPLLETSVLRPLATVTVKGEAYPLTIDHHEAGRGRVGPVGRRAQAGGGRRDTRLGDALDAAARRRGRLPGGDAPAGHPAPGRRAANRAGRAAVPARALGAAACRRRPAAGARGRPYSAHAVGLVAEEGEASWTEAGGWTLDFPAFPFGGGKLLSFGLRFGPAKTAGDARAALVTQFAGWAGPSLHPLGCVPRLDPADAVARLAAPEAYDMQGMERLYLKPPIAGEEGSHFAGFPHEPGGRPEGALGLEPAARDRRRPAPGPLRGARPMRRLPGDGPGRRPGADTRARSGTR